MRIFLLTAGFTLLIPVVPVAGQDGTYLRLIGEVRDFSTEQPVPDVAVRIVELQLVRLTDRNGFFAFDSVPVGRWTFEASGFGYATNVEVSEIGQGNVLLVRLEPQPVELQGLYVSVVQRLARRRLAAPSSVVAWERPTLEAAISPDIGSFIRTRGVAQFVHCGGESSPTDLPNCFMTKGRPSRLTVYIDDLVQLAAVGTSTLWAYDPRDLWSVEFIPGCGQLRIYTQRFMRLVQDGRVRLAHVLCIG